MERKLGKKPGVVHDARTFHLASLLTPTLPPVLREWRIATKLHDWPMFANDRIGDCTCASLAGHRVIAQEWSSGRRDIPVTDTDVLNLYTAVTGYDPAKPETDQGAYLLDVLRYARRHGFGKERDDTPHTITAYAKAIPGSTDQFKRAAHLFGGLYLGLALPIRAQHQDVWDLPMQLEAQDEPYSWGGHAVWMIGYDRYGVTLVTWGREQRCTWSWFKTYCDEAWATITEDFLNRKGRTPQGLDVERLRQLLGTLA